jgi:hypothetical protein
MTFSQHNRVHFERKRSMAKKLKDPTLPKTESEQKTVKPEVRRILTQYDYFWWQGGASVYGKSGISDTLAVHNSVFIAIEAKYGDNKPTALQVAFLNSIRAEGHFAFVVNEKNIEDFRQFIDDLDTSTKMVQRGEKVSPDLGSRMLNSIASLTALIPPDGVKVMEPVQSTVLHAKPGPSPHIEKE